MYEDMKRMLQSSKKKEKAVKRDNNKHAVKGTGSLSRHAETFGAVFYAPSGKNLQIISMVPRVACLY